MIFMPLSKGKSLLTSGMTLRGRAFIPICSNEGTLGRERGNELFASNGRLGSGFIACGEVRYETSCKHLLWSGALTL